MTRSCEHLEFFVVRALPESNCPLLAGKADTAQGVLPSLVRAGVSGVPQAAWSRVSYMQADSEAA